MFVESKYILDYNRRVKTPFGYQRIEEIHKTKILKSLKFIHERGELTVAEFHTFIIDEEEFQANEMRVGDHFDTVDGKSKILEIQDAGEQELYDITLDQSEFENFWYYTGGVLSHNSGKSITVACYLSWLYNFHKNLNIGIVANRGAQAREFLQNVKDIISRLPIWLMQGTTIWNKRDIANEIGSRILTDVPGSDSFRGYTVNCLEKSHVLKIRDELQNVKNITFGELFEILKNAKPESSSFGDQNFASNKNFEILTDSGFQPFLGLKRTVASGLDIMFDDGSYIKCTNNHQILRLRENNEFVLAKDLKVGDEVDGRIIQSIEIIPEGEFFDPVEVHGNHTYISDGFVHHNCLVCDEAAFVKTSVWEEFADSIFPSQSALAWKKNIIISTAKGLNHFYDIVQRAKLEDMQPNSKTAFIEVHWDEVPRYDSKGNLMEPEEFKRQIIKRYGRVYFEQNYGNSFVGSSETLIAPEVLAELQHKNPIAVWDDMLRLYYEPQQNHTYIMSVDAAKEGKDYFAIQVIDVTEMPFKQVAAANLQVDYLTMPDFLYEWGARFNTAHMIIENNEGAGQSIADMLVNHFEYPNIYYQDNKYKYPGFRTTKSTRDSIIRMLQILINSGKLEICDKETIGEFQRFELVNDKYQASSGHDDLVMALAISIAPMTNMDNFSDFGKFLDALKSDEVLDSGAFFEIGDLAFEDF